jgi:hypothetical protein
MGNDLVTFAEQRRFSVLGNPDRISRDKTCQRCSANRIEMTMYDLSRVIDVA